MAAHEMGNPHLLEVAAYAAAAFLSSAPALSSSLSLLRACT